MNFSLEGLRYEALEAQLAKSGVNPVHAKPLFRAVQRRLLRNDLGSAEGILPPLLRWLVSEQSVKPCAMELVDDTASSDGFTRKYLLRLHDGTEVESVQMGFSRHLTAGEIVAQAHHVERELRRTQGSRLRNIVMMGMGEPLHNFEPTMEALDIITDDRGMNIGPARVVISTVGYIPGIQKLTRHPKRYSLAVSLHGASDEERGKLIPINKRWPLAELLETCREYSAIKRARVFFAWTLIGGVNDSDDHAQRLAELLRGMDAHVNLIPLNPTEGFDGTMPTEERSQAFQKIIQDAGIPSTIRQRRGIDVAAGCGQLKAKRVKRTGRKPGINVPISESL